MTGKCALFLETPCWLVAWCTMSECFTLQKLPDGDCCVSIHLPESLDLQVDDLRAAFEEKLASMEEELAGHEGPFLLG